MTRKSLSKWMKIIIILFGICGAVAFGIVVPVAGLEAVDAYPEYGYCFVPWLVFLLVAAVPCYAVLVIAWQIAASISKDQSFTEANAKRLKYVSVIALATSVYFFAGNVIFLFLNMTHFGIMLCSMLVVFIGVAISVASAVMSYHVKKAAVLQEQSDLTI